MCEVVLECSLFTVQNPAFLPVAPECKQQPVLEPINQNLITAFPVTVFNTVFKEVTVTVTLIHVIIDIVALPRTIEQFRVQNQLGTRIRF